MRVKVSIIWLNYNSAKFINLALSSLKSLFELSNDDYEVIVVDNASSDNSFETIRNFIECSKLSKIRVKVVRSDMNRGYSGGINLGWMARNPESKYVVFSTMT
jgi:GT2 family glycosyltransferase